MNTPVNPSFLYIKVGCKRVYITRTCLHDAITAVLSDHIKQDIFGPFRQVIAYCCMKVVQKAPALLLFSNKQQPFYGNSHATLRTYLTDRG